MAQALREFVAELPAGMEMLFVLSKIPVGETAALTVTSNVVLVILLASSITFTVMVAVPVCPSAGATVNVVTPLLKKMMFPFGIRFVFDELPVRIRLSTAVSTSPIVILNGPTARPISVVLFGMDEMVGGLPEAPTFSTNVSKAVVVPSLTETVMVAEPVWPVAGVTVTVRFAPEPPKTMLFVGTKVGFDELFDKTRLPSEVSGSPMVNGIAAVGVLTAVLWLPMSLIVGDCEAAVSTIKLQPFEMAPA